MKKRLLTFGMAFVFAGVAFVTLALLSDARIGATKPTALPQQEAERPAASEPVAPVAVDLRDIKSDNKAAVSGSNNDPRNFGALDIVSQEKIEKLRKDAADLAPSDDVQIAPNGAITTAPAGAGTAFDSMDINDNPFDLVPPDPEMAAGLNHLIAVVNVSFEIYDKSGASLVGPTPLAALLGPAHSACQSPFDPNVLYDEKEDRFMIAADGSGTHYCAAVSQTSDPTGPYNVYAFSTASGSEFYDYPHAGIGEDAIFVGANIFDSGFKEGRIHAFEKAAMYAGGAAGSLVQNLGGSQDTPQPMNTHGFLQGTWPTDKKHYILTEPGR